METQTFFLAPLTPKPSLNNKAGDSSRYNSRFFFRFLKAPQNHHWDGTKTEENVNIGFHPWTQGKTLTQRGA